MGFTRDDLIQHFDRKGNHPGFWMEKATALLSSSAALLELWDSAIAYDPPHPIEALDYNNPALMLRAMAFECLLKARALRQGAILARGGRYVSIPGVKSHDLVGLASFVGFNMSPQEEAVMRRLSRWISAGRYPIQQNWNEQSRLRPDGKVEFLGVGWFPAWDDVCASLVERLTEGMDKESFGPRPGLVTFPRSS